MPQAEILSSDAFSILHDGEQTALLTLRNEAGMLCQVTSFGARVVSLFVPDSKGHFKDVVLGYHCIEDYINLPETFFGATIGRYANRIENAQFSLDGTTYHLEANEGRHHLHGGSGGFHRRVWKARQLSSSCVEFGYTSKEGEAGYPGQVEVSVTYELTPDNALDITYRAQTDQPTPFNLTHHSYFNLKGAGVGNVEDHVFQILADGICPVREDMIPQGDVMPVEGTPFDFNTPAPLAERLAAVHPQLDMGHGFDHNYVLKGSGFRSVALVREPQAGLSMEVFTDKPGLQCYTGNYLGSDLRGKQGQQYARRGAFCLEPQFPPNAIHAPDYLQCVLRPGQTYQSRTAYRFFTR